MRSTAAIFGWEFRQRHRWPLFAFVAYAAGVAAYRLLFESPAASVRLDPPDAIAALVIVPLSMAFFYLLAVFSFGLSGDLASRHSIYPARMFALPITTTALAGWPMLYGATAMTALWALTWSFARWWAIDLPLVWPGLLAIAFMAWTQVLTWKTYRRRGVRVIVTVAWLIALDAIVITAVELNVRPALMIAFLAPQLPLAYAAACFFLGRARRGDLPEWKLASRPTETAAESTGADRGFRSAARAQAWFEWRRHGWTLPVLVALVVPFELMLLFVPGNNIASIVLTTLLAALLTPPFLAGFVAAAVSKANPFARDDYGLTSFVATRPVSSAALIAAKLEMTVWSTLIAWAVMLILIPLALMWSETMPLVIERTAWFVDAIGTPRAIAIPLLAFAGMVALTWQMLVQNLCIGLSGRDWLIKASVFGSLVLLILIFPVARWFSRNSHAIWQLWDALPVILTALVAVKMALAGWVAVRLANGRLVSDRAMIAGAASWAAVVLTLSGVLIWLAGTPLIPHYVLMLLSILQVPLARLSAAPLALAWNRHR
jgi:hypothetical protein